LEIGPWFYFEVLKNTANTNYFKGAISFPGHRYQNFGRFPYFSDGLLSLLDETYQRLFSEMNHFRDRFSMFMILDVFFRVCLCNITK
jgi:hypothetical protein